MYKQVEIKPEYPLDQAKEDIRVIDLENGFRLATWRLPDNVKTEIRLCINAGAYSDPIGYAGTAHFLEHALFFAHSEKGIALGKELGKNDNTFGAYTDYHCRNQSHLCIRRYLSTRFDHVRHDQKCSLGSSQS